MRLINADDIETEMRNRLDMQDLYLLIHIKELVIDKMPTVEIKPVKHGRWSETKIPKVKECSCCHAQWGMYSIEEFGYCPTCGAKMDERKEE